MIGFAQSIYAQETIFEEGRTIYKRENSFGVVLHTTGWGLTYRYALYTSGFTRTTYDFDLVGIKHPKEIKIYSSQLDNSNGYFYGKLNSILILRSGIGKHNTFISKQSVRGIAISYVLNGGLSLAYAKPVYLEVYVKNEVSGLPDTEIVKYDPEIHTKDDINGKASWFRGLFTGKIYPGAYVKTGFNFESSRQASRINALEVGAILDLYYKKIPMMANIDNMADDLNHYYFLNLYVSLTFGSKKTE